MYKYITIIKSLLTSLYQREGNSPTLEKGEWGDLTGIFK